jgi:hypothetical protein
MERRHSPQRAPLDDDLVPRDVAADAATDAGQVEDDLAGVGSWASGQYFRRIYYVALHDSAAASLSGWRVTADGRPRDPEVGWMHRKLTRQLRLLLGPAVEIAAIPSGGLASTAAPTSQVVTNLRSASLLRLAGQVPAPDPLVTLAMHAPAGAGRMYLQYKMIERLLASDVATASSAPVPDDPGERDHQCARWFSSWMWRPPDETSDLLDHAFMTWADAGKARGSPADGDDPTVRSTDRLRACANTLIAVSFVVMPSASATVPWWDLGGDPVTVDTSLATEHIIGALAGLTKTPLWDGPDDTWRRMVRWFKRTMRPESELAAAAHDGSDHLRRICVVTQTNQQAEQWKQRIYEKLLRACTADERRDRPENASAVASYHVFRMRGAMPCTQCAARSTTTVEGDQRDTTIWRMHVFEQGSDGIRPLPRFIAAPRGLELATRGVQPRE